MKSISTKILVGAISLALISFNTYAKPNGHKPRGGNPAERLSAALQLDESQSQQLEVIMSDAREQHEALAREDRDAHCAIKAGVDLQIVELLSADQLNSFEEMRSERESRPDNRKGPGPLDCG